MTCLRVFYLFIVVAWYEAMSMEGKMEDWGFSAIIMFSHKCLIN